MTYYEIQTFSDRSHLINTPQDTIEFCLVRYGPNKIGTGSQYCLAGKTQRNTIKEPKYQIQYIFIVQMVDKPTRGNNNNSILKLVCIFYSSCMDKLDMAESFGETDHNTISVIEMPSIACSYTH